MIVIPRLEGEALTIGDDITIKVVEIDGDDVLLEINAPDDAKIDPSELVQKQMITAMDEVGKRFECNEYFVPELLIAAMQNTTDDDGLPLLAVALASLGEKLPAELGAEGAKLLISKLDDSLTRNALRELCEQFRSKQAADVAKFG